LFLIKRNGESSLMKSKDVEEEERNLRRQAKTFYCRS
jgi:hypothetical protein